MTPVSTRAEGSPGRAPAADPSALPAGFYPLTLVATLLSAFELRLRLVPGLPSISLLGLLVFPTMLAVATEVAVRPHLVASLGIYRRNRPLAGYVGYAGIAAMIGLLRSSDSLQAFYDLVTAFALYALVLITADTRARLLGVLAMSLAGAIPSLVLGLLQIATGGFYLVPRSLNIDAKLDLAGDTASNAPTGLLAHPNGLALYLLPIVVFLAVAAWRGFGKHRRSSVVLGGILAVTLVVLKGTYAKGVYAWLVAGLLFLVLPRRFARWRFWIALLVPFLGVSVLVWLAIDAFLQGDLQYGTVISRVELWLSALDIIEADRFVTVVGSGGPELLARGLVSFEYPNPHNAWLSQALTYGVPALLLYLAAFGSAFRSLARCIRSADAGARAIAIAAMASLMALLGENFFEPADRGMIFQAQLFLVFAIAARVSVAASSGRS